MNTKITALTLAAATAFARAWRSDRARLLRNWPASSVLHQWLDKALPPAAG